MPDVDIGSTSVADLTNALDDFSVDTQVTDGATGDKEFRWQMTEWPEYLGYYKEIPELQTAVDAKANWTMGAGFTAEEPTEILLSAITGNGKDTFNTILTNDIRVYTIAGDSYCEVIRDDDDFLVNLKPLDPSTIVIVQDKKGRVKRYEQVEKRKTVRKFRPEQIFHLSRKRIADEVHGVSVIPSVKWIILARNEAMNDWKTVLHRNVSPLQIHHLDTDDTSKVAAYKAKADLARAGGENLYIPKGSVEVEVIQSQLNTAASPLAWINQLNDYFFQAVNVPQIIIGNAKEFTDASAKIVYLAFEQSVKAEQLYIEEQVLMQLGLEIKLTFPASLQQDTISGQPNPEDQQTLAPTDDGKGPLTAATPNDTTAELEGQT